MQLTKNIIPSDSTNIRRSYLAVFLAAAVLYTITCAPSAVWQDSGMIQYRIWHNDIQGNLGLALSHPLFYLIGICAKYIPIGQFARRVNMISAITSAIAVANMFLLLRLWLGKNLPALLAAVSLALSHTFWRHATIPETYNLYIALLLAELIVILQYVKSRRISYLYLLGLFNGLAIANHMLGTIGFICYIAFLIILLIKKQIRISQCAVIVLLWIIGAGPYEYLIIKNIIQTGQIAGTFASAVFGNSWQGDVLNTTISLGMVKQNILFFLLNFPTPNILLFFAALGALGKITPSKAFRNIILILMILFLGFAFRYTIVDRYAFFIPFYCMAAMLTGIGFHLFILEKNRKSVAIFVFIFACLPIPIYAAAPFAAEKINFQLGTTRKLPYRDDYKYFLQPWRAGDRTAEQFAYNALKQIEKDAIIWADNNAVYPLLYQQQVKKQRQDVKIISKYAASKDSPQFNERTIKRLLAERKIYVVSPIKGYCPAFLLDNYRFRPAGIVWQIVE